MSPAAESGLRFFEFSCRRSGGRGILATASFGGSGGVRIVGVNRDWGIGVAAWPPNGPDIRFHYSRLLAGSKK